LSSFDFAHRRRFVDVSTTTLSRFEQTMLDLFAKFFNQRVVFMFFHTLFKRDLQTSHVQLNELNVCFRFENLHRDYFEVVTDLTQILLLQFDEFLRRCDDAVRALMRRVSNDRVVDNNRLNND
jgi:hypothetical protein